MTKKVITSLDQINAEWLTAVLTKSGALTNGSVATYDIDSGGGNWSTNAHLIISYSKEAEGDLPQHLFLKMVATDASSGDEFFGVSEVTYYTRDYLDVEGAPFIRCYDAAYTEEEQHYHLLLDDVSITHLEAAQKEPTLEYGLALAEGLGAMHARWWGSERLAEAHAPMHNANHIQRFVDIAKPGVEHILDRFANDLEAHWPELIHELFARHPQTMIRRTENNNGFTLIHGDAGHNNILVPREGERPIYIIDRQPFNWSLTTWLGVYDLAYAMVLDWDVETRRSLEIPVLRRYYERLCENGVLDYSWEQLLEDYSLTAAMGVYIATEYCRSGINRRIAVWLLMLKRSLAACDDWDCSELW